MLNDPLLPAGYVCRAVRRIARAIESRETVAVYGDYDVDGITSGCLLTEYLRTRGLICHLYIPDRLEEGYGLNTAAIDCLHKKGVTLIVTVDCGVTALEETAFAASKGIDMIITDHHECRGELPDAMRSLTPSVRTAITPDGIWPGSASRSNWYAPWKGTARRSWIVIATCCPSALWQM